METYFSVLFFSLKQNNQFGSHNDLHPEGKIKPSILHSEHSLQNNVRYSLGPSYKGSGTYCQVQPGILEAPAAPGVRDGCIYNTSSTVPQFLFLTLLPFTPSTRKFTFEKYFPASPISWTADPESCLGYAASLTSKICLTTLLLLTHSLKYSCPVHRYL